MKKFIKREWFKIMIVILLSIITISYAFSKYVYYQKQQIQLQEMQQEIRKEQRAKEKLYPKFLEIQKVNKYNPDEALRMLKELSEEEYEIYKLLKAELN